MIELIIAVLLVAIVTAVGIPALQRINDSNRLATRANGFLRTMEYARFTAIKRGLKVYVCGRGPSGNSADHKGLWRQGWLIFINFDGRSPPHLNHGDQLLSEDQAIKHGATVYSDRRYFEFTP